MILMGSAAAIRSDCLPDWRDGRPVADYDLVGTDDEFDALVDHFRKAGKHVVAHDRGVTHKAIRVSESYRSSDRILIDWVTMELESSRILARLDDMTDGEVFGFKVKLVSPLTHYVTRRASGYLLEGVEKVERDTAYFRQKVAGERLTPDHVALYRAIRREYGQKQA